MISICLEELIILGTTIQIKQYQTDNNNNENNNINTNININISILCSALFNFNCSKVLYI